MVDVRNNAPWSRDRGGFVQLGLTTSPQIDVLVLKGAYPNKLLNKKVCLAVGVAAAFECKTVCVRVGQAHHTKNCAHHSSMDCWPTGAYGKAMDRNANIAGLEKEICERGPVRFIPRRFAHVSRGLAVKRQTLGRMGAYFPMKPSFCLNRLRGKQ